MRRITIIEDIKDKFGRLYLKKGHVVTLTEQNINTLNKLGLLEEVLGQEEKRKKENIKAEGVKSLGGMNIRSKTEVFNENYKVSNMQFLDQAIDLVQDLVFMNKSSEWYLHIKALANHVDWIYSHSINTALLSVIVGLEWGYNEKRLNDLALGALLHDIGMILVPSHILNKQSALTIEEEMIIKKHCELGAAIIQGYQLPDISKKIIVQHHERLDGTGYPSRIKQEEIEEEVQIVMVTDVIDAATSYRPYQKAKGFDVILAEVRESKGCYSENVVNTLVKIYR